MLITGVYAQGSGKVLLENDQVRALEYAVTPGEKAILQARAPYVLFWLNASAVNLTNHGGKMIKETFHFEDVRWFDQAADSIENTDGGDAKFLIVEVKKPAPDKERVLPRDDGTKIAAEQYKILLENQRVRVIRVGVKPGEKTAMHSHPGSGFRYGLQEGSRRSRFTFPDGTTREQQGSGRREARWSQDASRHIIENIGENEIHNLLIEVK